MAQETRSARPMRWPKGWRCLVILALGLVTLAVGAANAVTIDGRITPGEYTHVYAVEYAYGTNQVPVSGGILAFEQSANGDLHLYYQAPTDLVDNTWGCEVGSGPSCSQIGTYKFDPHTPRELWRSDSFGSATNKMAVLGSTAGDIRFRVDVVSATLDRLDAVGSGAQTFLHGGFGNLWLGQSLVGNTGTIQQFETNGQYFLAAASSTAWNLQHFGPNGTGAIAQDDLDNALLAAYNARTGVFRDSPATDSNYSDPTTDNPVAPNALTLYDDSLFSGWQYQVAIEITLSGALFPNGEWMDTANHVLGVCPKGPDNCLPILDLGAAHFSRNKLGFSSRLNPLTLTPTIIPEPAALALMGLAVGVLARRARV